MAWLQAQEHTEIPNSVPELPSNGEYEAEFVVIHLQEDSNKIYDTKDMGEIRGMLALMHEKEPDLPDTHRGNKTVALTNLWPVKTEEINLVRLGLSWGVSTDGNYYTGTGRNFRRQNPHFNEHVRNSSPLSMDYYEKYFDNHWSLTNESKMISYIKKSVTEGLVEKLQVMIDHWEKVAGPLEAWPTIKSRIRGPNASQEISVLQTYVDGNLSDARANLANAQLEIIKLQVELERNFKTATTLTETLGVCKKYLHGDLGKDWFIRGFFKPICNYHEWRAETERLDKDNHAMNLHRLGNPANPFSKTVLAPFFKSRPALARMYSE